MKILNHYKWLEKNYEKFCLNSGFDFYPGAIIADGDKLSLLKSKCNDKNLDFFKVAAIGLAIKSKFKNVKTQDSKTFEETCIHLFENNPEWYVGCGGIEDAEEII